MSARWRTILASKLKTEMGENSIPMEYIEKSENKKAVVWNADDRSLYTFFYLNY